MGSVHPPGPALAGRETKVLTVPTQFVNQELEIRRAFGWELVQTSARSFATGGGFAGVGTHYQGLAVGGGRISLENVHFTDLVLARTGSSLSRQLAQLESKFDSWDYEPEPSKAPSAIIAIAGLPLSLIAYLLLGPKLGLPDWLYWLPAIVFGILALWLMAKRTLANEAANKDVTFAKQGILDQARRLQGGP